MAYVLRRFLTAVALIWLVVTLSFVLLRAAPGDAADLLLPPNASRDEAARLRADLGLDRPLAVQYARWLGTVLRGNLGESFVRHESVATVLRQAMPVSLWLGSTSLTLTFLVGVAVGAVQARRRGTWTDRLLTGLTTSIYAAPSYWLSLAAVAVFTYGMSRLGAPAWLRLPAFGVSDPAGDLLGVTAVLDLVRHSVLPIAVLAAVGASGIARYARTAFLDLARSDWVRSARAKGLRERAVVGRHLLANALAPLIVLATLSLPGIVAGSVFVETVFAWPGMGRMMVQAISARDIPVVMGATLVYASVVVLANAASDVLLIAADPRRR